MKKGKIVTIAVILTTVILAGVAIFTALRLYDTGPDPVAPTAPSSQPEASEQQQVACEALVFDLEEEPTPTPTGQPSASPSPTQSPTSTPTGTLTPTPTGQPTATPTEPPTGGGDPSPTPTDSPTATPTQGEIAQANSPTPTPDTGATGGTGDELPDAGFPEPVILFTFSGLLIILGAFILAF